MFLQVIEGQVRDADVLKSQMEAWKSDVKPGAIGFLGSTSGIAAPTGAACGLVRTPASCAGNRHLAAPGRGLLRDTRRSRRRLRSAGDLPPLAEVVLPKHVRAGPVPVASAGGIDAAGGGSAVMNDFDRRNESHQQAKLPRLLGQVDLLAKHEPAIGECAAAFKEHRANEHDAAMRSID